MRPNAPRSSSAVTVVALSFFPTWLDHPPAGRGFHVYIDFAPKAEATLNGRDKQRYSRWSTGQPLKERGRLAESILSWEFDPPPVGCCGDAARTPRERGHPDA